MHELGRLKKTGRKKMLEDSPTKGTKFFLSCPDAAPQLLRVYGNIRVLRKFTIKRFALTAMPRISPEERELLQGYGAHQGGCARHWT